MSRHARSAARVALALGLCVGLSVLQAGCGAGMGGTGTGDSPMPGLQLFGAAAAPVCQTALAATLGCSTASAAGRAVSEWVDVGTGGRVMLRVEADAVAVRDDCAARRFDGDWGVTPDGVARYWGSTLADGAARREPASLALVADGAGLQVQLSDLDGRPLGAAVPLRRARADDPPPAPCPG